MYVILMYMMHLQVRVRGHLWKHERRYDGVLKGVRVQGGGRKRSLENGTRESCEYIRGGVCRGRRVLVYVEENRRCRRECGICGEYSSRQALVGCAMASAVGADHDIEAEV